MTNIKWDNHKIKEGILDVMYALGLTTMPTANEIILVMGNEKLSSAIKTRGGYTYWAKKLSLKKNGSTSHTAEATEHEIAKILSKKNDIVEMTSYKCPYDLLINERIKVEVKFAREHDGYYRYLLHKPHQSDFTILMLDNKKTLVIPSHKLNVSSLKIKFDNVYDHLENKFELINTLDVDWLLMDHVCACLEKRFADES